MDFATTRWSLVLDAGAEMTPRGRAALGTLCELSWYPLYAYLRRRGQTAEDAQDLTQGFFARLLEKQALNVVDPSRGRFRSFLLASLDHYVSNQRDRDHAQKRGGSTPPISLDDYVRLPHVLTSLRPGRSVRGVVDDALEKLGLRRTVVLTTPRFLAVPSLVARAPVVVTMHARLARMFAAELGLSISPPPVELREVTISLLWHASYDADPAHAWLRQLVVQLAADL